LVGKSIRRPRTAFGRSGRVHTQRRWQRWQKGSRGNSASISRRRSRPFRPTIPSRNEWQSHPLNESGRIRPQDHRYRLPSPGRHRRRCGGWTVFLRYGLVTLVALALLENTRPPQLAASSLPSGPDNYLGCGRRTRRLLNGGAHHGCAFCLDKHSKDLGARGETEQRLYMSSAWREVPHLYSDRERAALAWPRP
jgi:hypothetical protein